MQRRYPTTIAALALLISACSGSDSGPGPDGSSSTSGVPTTAVGAGDTDGEGAGTPENADDREASAPVAETTDPAPTTTTTTTTAPPGPITVTEVAIDAGLDIRSVKDATHLTTLPGDPITAIVSGGASAARGERQHATTWWTTTGRTWEEVALDDEGALESRAYGVAGNGDRAVVVGVAAIDGVHRSVVWRSDDRGATYGAPEYPIDEASLGAHAAFVGDEPVVVSWRVAEEGRRLVASRSTGGGWSNSELPPIGREPWVSGMQSDDALVVVTGQTTIEGRVTGAVWRSIDGGETFEVVDDPAISASSRIGAPAIGGDGFIATAARPDNGATVLVTSTDGATWRVISLTLTRNESPRSGANGGSGPVIAVGDGYVFGIVDQLAGVAIVDESGRGAFELAPYNQATRFRDAHPFLLSNGLHAIGSSPTSFIAAAQQEGSWTNVGQPGPAAAGPTATGLELFEISSGLVARTTAWPLVEPSGTSGITWRSANALLEFGDGGWAETEDSPAAHMVLTDGDRDIALVYMTDPADDGLAGPNRGTGVAVRSGDAWGPTELVLSGPGGDALHSAVATGDGLVAVGARFLRDANQVSTATIVVMEEADGVWTELPVTGEFTDQAQLDDITIGGDGSLVATGFIFEDGVWRPLVVSRGADGWRRVPLPTADDSARIREVISTAAGVEIITNERDSWFRYRPADDGSYVASPIELPDPTTDFPSEVVALDGRLIVIGTTERVGLRSLTVWELTPGGTARPLELAGPPTGRTIGIDSAIAIDGRIAVGGTRDDRYLIWEIDLGDQ